MLRVIFEDPSGRKKAQQQWQQRDGKQVAKPSGPNSRNNRSHAHEINKWALRRHMSLKEFEKREMANSWAIYDVEK